MAISKHQQVRDAILARFAGMVPAGQIKPGRAWPVPAQAAKFIKVYLDTSQAERAQFSGQPDDWNTRIRCEFHARGDDADTAEDVADALLVEAYGLVLSEPSLGDLCMDCKPVGIAWSTDEADTTLAVVQLVFEAQHRTVFNSIAAA
jgi:hypothetical protein